MGCRHLLVKRRDGDRSFQPGAPAPGGQAFWRSDGLSYLHAVDYLQEMIALVALTEDARAGAQAFFEQRSPRWTGRCALLARPAAAPRAGSGAGQVCA